VLDAFADQDPIKKIMASLKNVHPMATVLLAMDGTIRGSEQELVETIKQATADLNIEGSSYGFRDLSRVVEHPVYALFEARLEELERASDDPLVPEEAEALRRLVIQAMVEAGV